MYQPTIHVVTGYSYMWFFILVIVGAGVLYFAKLNGHTLLALLGGVAMLFLLYFLVGVSRQRPPDPDPSRNWAYPRSPKAPVSVSAEEHAEQDIFSNEAWKQVAKFRVQLDETEHAKQKSERPGWVDANPKQIGDIYQRVVSSDPYSTKEECHRQLGRKLQKVTLERLNNLSGAVHTTNLKSIGIGLDYILSDICKKEYIETKTLSVGDMKQIHMLMEFTSAVDQHLAKASKQHLREQRIEALFQVSMATLVGLASVYGLLKFDTWTRGYYTKRLVAGIMVAGLVLLALAAS